jgi:hypothetical protein
MDYYVPSKLKILTTTPIEEEFLSDIKKEEYNYDKVSLVWEETRGTDYEKIKSNELFLEYIRWVRKNFIKVDPASRNIADRLIQELVAVCDKNKLATSEKMRLISLIQRQLTLDGNKRTTIIHSDGPITYTFEETAVDTNETKD